MPAQTDDTVSDLLHRISKGDEHAFRELYHRFAALVYHFAHQHTHHQATADDIVQDIFTQLWLTRESATQIKNVNTYLFVLTKHAVINQVKRSIRQKQREAAYANDQLENAGNEGREEQLSVVEQAIENLPEQQKKAWTLSRRQGLTYAQVAAQMNLSRETVKKYLQYAHASIAKYLQDHMELLVIILVIKNS